MIEISIIEENKEEFIPPSYTEVGDILVDVYELDEIGKKLKLYNWEYDVLDYSGCVFWMNEGAGFQYWLDEICTFPSPGRYLIKGVVGRYIRGDGWTTEDSEDFEYKEIIKY